MNVYLMRHANAGLRRDNPLLDAKRALIKEGKDQCMPGAAFADFQDLLTKYETQGREGVLVVGHNPSIFQFVGRLISGNGPVAIRMRKASIARVDMKNHPPRMQWLIDPRTARLIYDSVGKSSRPKTSRK